MAIDMMVKQVKSVILLLLTLLLTVFIGSSQRDRFMDIVVDRFIAKILPNYTMYTVKTQHPFQGMLYLVLGVKLKRG